MRENNSSGTQKMLAVVLAAVDVVLLVVLVLTFLLVGNKGNKTEPKLASGFKANAETYMNMDVTKEYPADMNVMYNGNGVVQAEEETKTETVSDENGSEFVFPDSDTRLLTDAEIREKITEKSQLRYAVNEIYARHGYQFETEEYRDYFNGFDWYKKLPKESDMDKVSAMFSKTEKKNVDKLQKYSKSKGWS